jgi:putative thioredoxin
MTTAISFDTDTAGFEHDVIEASREVPVVVDFWASWCAPCRALKPVLEKLAKEYQGKFRLAKLDTDAHPQIAGEYGVRGIPNVKAFVDGEVAAEFTGALPEAQVRQFLEKLIPSQAQQLQRAARDDVWAGRLDAAEAKLRDAIAADAKLWPAHADLAEVLLAKGDPSAAAAALGVVPDIERDDRTAQIASRIEVARKAAALPEAGVLRAAIAANPDDLEARIRLAERLVADGDHAAALDTYLEVVERDRQALRERARLGMLDVFRLAVDADLVSAYRRRLAAALN